MSQSGSSYQRILIFNPYGIGDCLCTSPIVKNLRHNFPQSYIAYMCNSRAAPILESNRMLDEIIVFEKSQIMEVMRSSKVRFVRKVWNFFNFIRNKKFDLVIDLSVNAQYGFFLKLANIKNRIGFDYKGRGRFLTKKIALDSFNGRHIVEHYLGVLKLIGLEPESYCLELSLPAVVTAQAITMLKEKGIVFESDLCVGICPGGGQSWGKQAFRKHWLADRFAKVADTLIDELKVKIIVFAGPEEIAIGKKVAGLMKNKAIDLSGSTTLTEFVSLMSRCRLLITNDGGPVHIASALGVRTVSLFGPVDDLVYGPYPRGEKNSVIKKDIVCRPCYQKFRLPACSKDRECIRAISVEEVVSEAKEQLAKELKQRPGFSSAKLKPDEQYLYPQDKISLSVVVLAKNEKRRLKGCLESVSGWTDEIIVVDDESSDSTVQIAKEFTDRVLVKKMDIEGKQRNWAYAQAKNDWVLSLDADERVTGELKREIAKNLTSNQDYNAFTIPRKNFIGNYWIRWGGLYPSSQLKLLRKDKFKWEEVEVHPRAFLEGECGHLKGNLIHYTYRDWTDFLRKLNFQTTLEAKKWYKLSLVDPKKAKYKMNLIHALWRTVDRFIRAFFIKQGFRDGFIGFMVAYFASLYQIVSFIKYRDLKSDGRK